MRDRPLRGSQVAERSAVSRVLEYFIEAECQFVPSDIRLHAEFDAPAGKGAGDVLVQFFSKGVSECPWLLWR